MCYFDDWRRLHFFLTLEKHLKFEQAIKKYSSSTRDNVLLILQFQRVKNRIVHRSTYQVNLKVLVRKLRVIRVHVIILELIGGKHNEQVQALRVVNFGLYETGRIASLLRKSTSVLGFYDPIEFISINREATVVTNAICFGCKASYALSLSLSPCNV